VGTLLSIKKPSKKGHQDSCSHIGFGVFVSFVPVS
jgi:hypothetical protein